MRRLNILYIEDKHENTELLARACEVAGLPADLHEVPGGTEAISYLRDGKFQDREGHPLPDVIILDLRTPGMNGFDFLNWHRQEPAFNSIPVLVFTESTLDEDRARATAAGAAGYFVKPLNFEALVGLTASFKQPEKWSERKGPNESPA